MKPEHLQVAQEFSHRLIASMEQQPSTDGLKGR